MKSKLLNEHGEKTYALIFDTGDALMKGLEDFAAKHGLDASHFTGIGAFQQVRIAYFDWETRKYQELPLIDEQVEVLTLAGDIALKDGKPTVHAHVVLGKSDGSAMGGHLLEATVRPTAEVVLTESPTYLRREYDELSGLPLISV